MSTVLVADIGGTNGRFAIADGQSLQEFKVLPCAEYPTLGDMIKDYLSSLNTEAPKAAAIAVATYVAGDEVSFTNLPWVFSVKSVAKECGFNHFKVINDFTAISVAVPTLQSDQLIQVGGNANIEDEGAKAIIGPGTGLGVSGLFSHNGTWVPVQGQGGHVLWGAANSFEQELFTYINQQFQPVSAENLLCGKGLKLLYESVCAINGESEKEYSIPEVVTLGTEGKDGNCTKAVEVFCTVLGRVAGDLTLTLGARSGLYVGGGVVSHFTDFLIGSGLFRKGFEDKGRMSEYMLDIPAYIITEKKIGLIGANESMKKEYDFIGETYNN